MKHGSEPPPIIDHTNGNHLDNRPCNLREVTHSQNMMNRKLSKHSTSGIKGVAHRKDNDMWRAYISVDGRKINLGQYETKEEAAQVVGAARLELHGEFARAA